MRILLSARCWIVLSAVIAPATAAAEPAAERAAVLPNAADPKPGAASPQGTPQIAVVSLEKRAEHASKDQTSSQAVNLPRGKREGKPAPFRRPGSN
jgi:hypothetical protein